eukprot:10917224-Alexandrium_andersonii.AAC.1
MKPEHECSEDGVLYASSVVFYGGHQLRWGARPSSLMSRTVRRTYLVLRVVLERVPTLRALVLAWLEHVQHVRALC